MLNIHNSLFNLNNLDYDNSINIIKLQLQKLVFQILGSNSTI